MTSPGLPELVAALMMIALTAYALTGGADFGGGVWDLLAGGPRREQQREHISHSIAPIWEANHVWLIVVVVMLFTGFPRAFSTVSTVMHIPLTIVLLGIVLRGSAFVFRSYGARTETQRHRWGAVFSVASIVTPVFLGTIVGALSTARVGEASRRVGAAGASFASVFVDPWAAAFPVSVGLLTLALFAFLAAVYLAYNAPDAALAGDFRTRALNAAVASAVLAGVTLFLARGSTPDLVGSIGGIATQAAAGLAMMIAAVALRGGNYRLARIAAAATVASVMWGWAFTQFPYLIKPTLTIRDAAAPTTTLVPLVGILVVGAAILIPALRYLYGLFTRPAAPGTPGTGA